MPRLSDDEEVQLWVQVAFQKCAEIDLINSISFLSEVNVKSGVVVYGAAI